MSPSRDRKVFKKVFKWLSTGFPEGIQKGFPEGFQKGFPEGFQKVLKGNPRISQPQSKDCRKGFQKGFQWGFKRKS